MRELVKKASDSLILPHPGRPPDSAMSSSGLLPSSWLRSRSRAALASQAGERLTRLARAGLTTPAEQLQQGEGPRPRPRAGTTACT